MPFEPGLLLTDRVHLLLDPFDLDSEAGPSSRRFLGRASPQKTILVHGQVALYHQTLLDGLSFSLTPPAGLSKWHRRQEGPDPIPCHNVWGQLTYAVFPECSSKCTCHPSEQNSCRRVNSSCAINCYKNHAKRLIIQVTASL